MSEMSDSYRQNAEAFTETLQRARMAVQMGEVAFRTSRAALAVGHSMPAIAHELRSIASFLDTRALVDRADIPDFTAAEGHVVAVEVTPHSRVQRRSPDGTWENVRVGEVKPGQRTFMGTLLAAVNRDDPPDDLVQVVGTQPGGSEYRIVLGTDELPSITYTTRDHPALGRPYPPVPQAPDTIT